MAVGCALATSVSVLFKQRGAVAAPTVLARHPAELRRRITFPDGHADMWPLFYDPILFRRVIDELAEPLRGEVTKIAGIESRGFLLGAAVAARLDAGFVAIRQPRRP